jgi:hypothetical protein
MAFGAALGIALVAIPVYVVLATAQFTLRSAFDLGAIVPAARASGFGRDFLDLELVLALFGLGYAALHSSAVKQKIEDGLTSALGQPFSGTTVRRSLPCPMPLARSRTSVRTPRDRRPTRRTMISTS